MVMTLEERKGDAMSGQLHRGTEQNPYVHL